MDLTRFTIATLEQDSSTIDELRFSNDGRWLASSSHESVVVWDVANAKRRAMLRGQYVVASVDETSLIVSDHRNTTTYDASAKRTLHTISCFAAYDRAVDRDLLVGIARDGGRQLQVRKRDGKVLLSVDVSLAALRDCTAPLEGAIAGAPMPGARGSLAPADTLSELVVPNGLAISPDGRRIALVSGSQVFLFDGESGQVIRRLGTLTQRDITGVCLTDEQVAFVTMGGTLAVHHAADGRVSFHHPLGAEARSVHLAAGGEAVAVTLWDPSSMTLVFPLSGQEEFVSLPMGTEEDDMSWRARFSPAGDRLAVGGDNGTIRLFSVPLSATVIMTKVEHVEDGLECMGWAFQNGRYALLVDLAKELRGRFDATMTPQLRGWVGHFEYQGFYHQKRWQEAWDGVMALGQPDCMLTPNNSAFRCSMAVEIAFHLGKIDEIPNMADACIRIREQNGDAEGIRLCREMTARYLQQAGRPELAARYGGGGWASRMISAFKRLLPGQG